ncbi:CRISPR-associated endonuclease Cas2 [Sharpea azabuensis]|uniref:CRISPR-associated endonuclease Cas2 n=1 Tax=Sharpea azabuensis TaxID=322505 RepID=UPI00156B4805|nr:CRISPR-associated endonuclease Cas2 [Sharpea azabuensis]
MFVLITYDIKIETKADQKRLRRVAKLCQNFGQRVQNSVFECQIDSVDLRILKHELCKTIDINRDSLRFYYLGKNYKNKIEHIGVKSVRDINDPLIF